MDEISSLELFFQAHSAAAEKAASLRARERELARAVDSSVRKLVAGGRDARG
jgi:hypothetical protein